MHLSSRLHLLLALSALVVLVIGGWNAKHLLPIANINEKTMQSMSVLHINSASLRLEYSTKKNSGIAVFINDGNEPISIVLPKNWALQEIRGMATSELNTNQPNKFAFEWNIPPSVRLLFNVTDIPKSFILHNSKNAPLKLSLISINMETEEILNDIFLIEDEPHKLW